LKTNILKFAAAKSAQLIVVFMLCTGASMASYVYTYIGNNYDTFATDRSGNIYDASMHIELSFTVDSLLTDFVGDAARLLTSDKIFDGVNLLTEANSYPGFPYVVNLNTDSSGNVNQWQLRGYIYSNSMTNIGDRYLYVNSSYIIGFEERDAATTYECITMPFGDCINGYYRASVPFNRGTLDSVSSPNPSSTMALRQWPAGTGRNFQAEE